MSNTNRKKELSRRMRVRFWILTLICFAVITLLSLGFYLIYYNIPFQETDSMNPEAEALAEEQMEDVPGEAVFTSGNVSEMSGAKLQKEQTRAQNKETLLEIINNANISDTQKQEAVNSMITMTDIAEKETAAEILLEAKGFSDAVVSIDGDSVDVVVNTEELTEAQRAQIEDIVIRKTGVSADSIIISTVNAN